MVISNFGASIFLQVLSWYVVVFCSVCRISCYNCIICNLCTTLYYLSVRICVQRIMISLMSWHKHSTPPVTPMKLVASAASVRLPHLKSQWWCSKSVARCRRSTRSALILSGPVTHNRQAIPASPFKPPPPPSPPHHHQAMNMGQLGRESQG